MRRVLEIKLRDVHGVLAFEDSQWMDTASWRLIREVLPTLRRRLLAHGHADAAEAITADLAFTGGAIPIGAREVVAAEELAELGVACRPTAETLADMADALLAARAAAVAAV